jgi:hypothetical protein
MISGGDPDLLRITLGKFNGVRRQNEHAKDLFLFNQRRTANPITCVVIANATFLDPDNRVAGEQWERQLQRLVLGRVDRRLASTAIPLSRGPWFSWRPVACETRGH